MFIYFPDNCIHLEAARRRVHGGNVLAVTDVLYRKLGRGIPGSVFRGSGMAYRKGIAKEDAKTTRSISILRKQNKKLES